MKKMDIESVAINRKKALLAAIKTNSNRLQFASEEQRSDKASVLAAVQQNGWMLAYASEALQQDREIVLAAVTNDGWALQFACEELRNDASLVSMAIRTSDGNPMQFASEALRADKALMVEAVKKNGWALAHASPKLQDDKEVVFTAVQSDGWALQFASEALRDHPTIVLAAIRKDREAFEFVSEEMRKDEDVILAMESRNEPARDDHENAMLSNCEWHSQLELVDKNGLALVTKNNYQTLFYNGVIRHAQLWKPGRNIRVYDTHREKMRMINPRVLELPPEIDSNKIRGIHKSNFAIRKSENRFPNFNDVLNSSNYNLKVVPNVLGEWHRKDFVSKEPNTILVKEGFMLRGIENNGNPLFENDVLALSAIKTILDSTGGNKIFLLEELIHSWYLNDHTTQLKISTKMFWCINTALTNSFNFILKHYLGLPSIEIGLIINPYKDQREISVFVDIVGKHLGKFYQDIVLSDLFFEYLITLAFPALNDKTKLVENEKEFNKNTTDNDLVFYVKPRIGAGGTDKGMFDITGFATVESGVEKPAFVISPTETPNLYQLVNDIYRAKKNDFVYPITIGVGVFNSLTVTKSFVTGEYLGSVSEFEDDMED